MDTALGTFRGVRVFVSESCLEDTEVRLFPESKNRSARIRKKLIKRFGGEYERQPCMYLTPHGYFCHPTLYRRLSVAAQENSNGHKSQQIDDG